MTIKVTTTELKSAVNSIHERQEEMEIRISKLEDTADMLVSNNDSRDKKVEMNHSQELENHCKKNNVRLVGLKETYGTKGTMEACVKKVLREGLNINVDGEFEVERAHQTTAPRPGMDYLPRVVLIRFLRQSARAKVLALAREKRGMLWENLRLSVFPDVSRELALKRESFTAVRKALQLHNVRYKLASILINKIRCFVLVRELKDEEGRMVCIEAVINGIKMVLLTYTPVAMGGPWGSGPPQKMLVPPHRSLKKKKK